MLTKVKDRSSLYKDDLSKGIINDNRTEYESYRLAKKRILDLIQRQSEFESRLKQLEELLNDKAKE